MGDIQNYTFVDFYCVFFFGGHCVNAFSISIKKKPPTNANIVIITITTVTTTREYATSLYKMGDDSNKALNSSLSLYTGYIVHD